MPSLSAWGDRFRKGLVDFEIYRIRIKIEQTDAALEASYSRFGSWMLKAQQSKGPALRKQAAPNRRAIATVLESGKWVMNLYERWILPPILDLTMRQEHLARYRRAVVGAARGRVLEIGVGSGLNLPLYGDQVELVCGIDPSPNLLAMARRRAAASTVSIELLLGSATQIPLEDGAVDTVVMTWTLCSIPDPLAALREMRRVLKPNGSLCFVEHGLSPEPSVERWQHRLTPAWRRIAGGCHLDRKIDDLIRLAGFDLTNLQVEYAPGPRAMSYMYEGCACRNHSEGIGPAF